MLGYMRKHATSFIIKVALAVIVLSFVLWGGFSYQERKENRVVSVNGQYILRDDFQRTLDRLVDNLRRSTGESVTQDMINGLKLKERAINILIDDALLTQAARKMGLRVGDESLRAAILEFPAFKRNGRFDERLYRSLLNNNRLDPREFEEGFRKELTMTRLKGILDRTAKVSDDEARMFYDYMNEKRTVYFAAFDPANHVPGERFSEQRIEEYFSEHKEEWRVPEKRVIDYVLFSPRDFEGKVEAGEEEVRLFYNRERSRFTVPRKVRARHILFRLPRNPTVDDVEKTQEKAQTVLKMARGGVDFAELARKYSEGPTAEKGGDLGFFSKEEVVKPFADLAFSLEPGRIGGPVRTVFGFHVIKVEEEKGGGLKPFEQVKERARQALIKEESSRFAIQAAEEFYDALVPGTSLEKVAKEFGYKVEEAAIVRGSPVEGLGKAEDLVGAVFDIEPGEVTPLYESPEGRVIAELSEIVPSRIPTLREVRDRVVARLRLDESKKRAKEAARELLEAARSAGSLAEAAKKAGIEVKKAGPFTREEGVLGVTRSPGVVDEVFALKEVAPLAREVMEAGGKFYVFELKDAVAAPERGFADEKEDIKERLVAAKGRLRFEEFLKMLRSKAEIELLQKL